MMRSLRVVPGFDSQRTPALAEAGIIGGQFIRWRDGIPEKLGGWAKFFASSMGSIPRGLCAWQDINGNYRLAVGSVSSLKMLTGGSAQDITPQQTVTNTSPNFSTVINTPTVTIIDSNISNPTINNAVFIETPVSVGGIVLFGIYPIATIISSTSYTITAASNATATVNNAGAVPSFNTTNNSATVQVTLNNHGLVQGQTTGFLVSTTVGGVTISGSYIVQAPVATNTFNIVVNGLATSTTSGSENAGNVRTLYYIALGPQSPYSGYGANTYGTGGWGTGSGAPAGAGTPITATDWWLVNFGEVLIANPTSGAIYQWGPESAFQNAPVISQAPAMANGIFLAQPQQIIVAWGASSNGIPNPLRLAWCDAGNFLQWTPTSSNFAGGYTIPRGSKIVGAMQAVAEFLVWTDLSVWSGQYVGQALGVFSIIEVMTGCGLIGPKAAGVLGEVAYWMSQKEFFAKAAGGPPQPLPCRVRDFIFQNLDPNNVSKIRCFTNAAFHEVGWFFPSLSGGSGENDSYVKYNAIDNEWDTGPLGRSAWTDQSVLGTPIGGATNGFIYQHEVGYDMDGAAMNPQIQTGTFRLADGEDFQLVDYVIPDFRYGPLGGAQNANLLLTFQVVEFPSDTQVTAGPFTATSTTPIIEPRLRGRDMSVLIQSQDLGSFWRGGLLRYRTAPDGRNP
jgi:hypothetical protein